MGVWGNCISAFDSRTDVLAWDSRYFLRRRMNRPPMTSEITMKAIAAHEKAVLSVANPIVKKAMPRMRNAPEALRLF